MEHDRKDDPNPGAPSDVDRLRARLASGEVAEVRLAISERIGLGGGVRVDDPLAWAELCEEAGLPALATSCWEEGLRRKPTDLAALEGFTECCREQGMQDRAIRVLEELHTQRPEDMSVLAALVAVLREAAHYARLEQLLAEAERRGAPPELLADLQDGRLGDSFDEDAHAAHVLLPSEADLVRFLDTFGGREDVHARQWYEPSRGTGYSPVRQPLTLQLVRNHLLGNVTLGVYPVRRDGTVGFVAFDLDLDPAVVDDRRSDGAGLLALREELELEVATLHDRIAGLGLDPLIEDSGYKGRHVWVALDGPVDAGLARRAALALARDLPVASSHVRVEVFPKQARVRSGGLGNLIKLPLGVHRRTGRRSRFLDASGNAISEPWRRLRDLRRADTKALERAIEELGPPVLEMRRGRHGSRRERDATAPTGPRPAEAPWTAGHLLADVEVRTILEGCGTIGDLARRALRGEVLSYDERVVVRHSLGHLHNGAHAVNYLYECAGRVTDELAMGSRLRCGPMSCRRIRERLGMTEGSGVCECVFPFAPDTYAHPLLFLRRLSAADLPSPADREPDSTYMIAEALARLRTSDRTRLPISEERRQEERALLERRLARRLEDLPDRALRTPCGTHRLIDEGGLTRLEFLPAAADLGDAPAGGRA